MLIAIVSRDRSVKKTGCNKFGVATQDIPVVTRTRRVHQNSVTTLSKSVTTESKKKPKEQVVTENCMLRQRLATKTENSVATERPIWAIILGIHNAIIEV